MKIPEWETKIVAGRLCRILRVGDCIDGYYIVEGGCLPLDQPPRKSPMTEHEVRLLVVRRLYDQTRDGGVKLLLDELNDIS